MAHQYLNRKQPDEAYFTTSLKIRIKSVKFLWPVVSGEGFVKYSYGWHSQTCIGSGDWYADKVGEVWEAIPFSKTHFRINNPVGCGFFFVHGKDCELN